MFYLKRSFGTETTLPNLSELTPIYHRLKKEYRDAEWNDTIDAPRLKREFEHIERLYKEGHKYLPNF